MNATEILMTINSALGLNLTETLDLCQSIVLSTIGSNLDPDNKDHLTACYEYLKTEGLIPHTSLVVSQHKEKVKDKDNNPQQIYELTKHDNLGHSVSVANSVNARTINKTSRKSNFRKNNTVKNSSISDINNSHIIYSNNEYVYGLGRSKQLIFKTGGKVFFRDLTNGAEQYVTAFITYNPYVYHPIDQNKFTVNNFTLITANLAVICNYNRHLIDKSYVKGKDNIFATNKKIEDLIYFLLMTGIDNDNKKLFIGSKIETNLETLTNNQITQLLKKSRKLGIDCSNVWLKTQDGFVRNKDRLREVLYALETR